MSGATLLDLMLGAGVAGLLCGIVVGRSSLRLRRR